MAKNILVFFPHRLHESFGGAYTYLFHLQKAFHGGEVELHFLHEMLALDEERVITRGQPALWKERFKKLVPSKLLFSRRIKRYLDEKYHEPALQQVASLDFSVYDAIHFHETIDLWRCLRFLGNYKGKIILTSHSPKPYHLELLEDVFHLQLQNINKQAYRQLEAIDRVAFSNAHIVLSPTPESMETYKIRWAPFADLVKNKQHIFLPTGIEAPEVEESSTEVRQHWKITSDAFVICFNGRHQPIKGYDLLVTAAERLLNDHSEVVFLITGKEDNSPMIEHPRWIQTGWTSAPQDILNASDLVVVPNRETFFDLNVLQALAIGKPLLLSQTGGNKFFRTFKMESILFMEELTAEALQTAISTAYSNRLQLASHAPALQQLFREHFSSGRFAADYHRFYLSV